MLELFSELTKMLNTGIYLAIISSFFWGFLSIVLSPCHLSSIPLIVGFINDTPDPDRKSAFSISLLFSIGILVTTSIIGVLTGAAGRILGDTGFSGKIIPGVLMIVFGFYLTEIIKLPFLNYSIKPVIFGNEHISSFMLGLVFGIALGPCTFTFLAPLLGIVFSTANTSIFLSLLILSAYAAGHCLVIVLAGTFSEIIRQILNRRNIVSWVIIIKRSCGVLVVIAGFYLLLK